MSDDKPDTTAASIRNFSSLAKDEAARQRLLVEVPEIIQKKAQLISAHFLLPAGARLVDMGCETGEVTYMLAILNPRAEIIGVDSNPNLIDFARKTYRLPNLSYRIDSASVTDMEDESIDGIVNSNILHHVYSSSRYDPRAVTDVLDNQTRKLKTGGTMLVRDYVMPPEGEFVQLELPDVPGKGEGPLNMSDADLLILYSQHARPMAAGHEGFFIEELPPKNPKTRLFRLPHKWAYEFICRKNYRADWEREMQKEYTFFSWPDYRREFTRLGLRMVFAAPYWNPWVVKNRFQGRFQLYNEQGAALGTPPTNNFLVAQKVADRQSLILEERRPSQKPAGDLQIMVVRDKKTGHLHELVKRPGEYCDIVPYRITADNRLVIYVRSGYPRPIINAAMRGSQNLDGKKWSGHLIEPITLDTAEMTGDVEENRRMIFEYTGGYTGLRAKTEESWFVGATYFPSPDRIDEAIEPVFIEVENPQKTVWPIHEDKEVGFTEIGTITELDAADIILAAQVGLLPEPRLEMHVLDLMSRYGITPPRWIGETMPKMPGQPVKHYKPEDILKEAETPEFVDEKLPPSELRAVRSVFVEEGRVGHTTRGLSAQDLEFIITADGIENIAVVVPISRDWDNNLLVSMEPKMLPVPNRMGGPAATLNAPSFPLPQHVKTIDEAKAYVAGKFKVTPDHVGQLGESYFTHAGVTPQRVYPFVVSSATEGREGQKLRYTTEAELHEFFRRFSWSYNMAGHGIYYLARLQMRLGPQHGMSMERAPEAMRYKDMSLSTQKTAVQSKDSGYSAVPSRVLGQRGPHTAAPAPAAPPATPAAKIIEGIMTRRSATPLTQSYSQALHAKDGMQVSMKNTPSVAQIEKNIGQVAAQLKSGRREPAFEPTPPK